MIRFFLQFYKMRKNLYIILVLGTLTMLLSILLFSKKPERKIPSLKERKGAIALSGEWLNSKKAIEGLLALIEEDPTDIKSKLALSQAYIQEGRITGDHAYYDRASLELLDNVLESEPNNFDALCCKSTVLLSQHHFSEGLEIAHKAVKINPYSAFVYGILCDAQVELGNYNEAVKMADKMVSVRPDIRSYSRISYLREIFGDYEGAKEAMKLAVSAGYPGLEQTEWARCVLGHLYECTGEYESAEVEYNKALSERPDYAFAIAGLGRVEKSRGKYKKAIEHFEKAKSMIVEYSFSDELTELYHLNKNYEKSKINGKAVIEMLGDGSDVEKEEGHGHYADKEIAYAYLKLNDTESALKHAMIEYERRPENIDVCETVSWIRYRRGDFAGANNLIDKALRTGSNNPQLLCRAGLIKIKAGDLEQGKKMINTALSTKPLLELDVKKELLPYISG